VEINILESFELEPSSGFEAIEDRRRRMEEPLPVRLVAVDDVRLRAMGGIEKELDEFYVGLWEFEREAAGAGWVVYRAENFRLKFEIVAEFPVERDSLRPQGIEVMSLAEAEHKLVEAEIEYVRQRGLTPGQESLLVLDPAGNWIELIEHRVVG
jgi:hypothetical protein